MPGRILVDASFFEGFNKLKINYECEKRITIYIEPLTKLRIDECERLSKGLDKAFISIENLKMGY